MDTKLFEPRVLGKGILIDSVPTEPNHGARITDVWTHTKMLSVPITNATKVEIPLESELYIVQVFDSGKQIIIPNTAHEETTGVLTVEFLNPQSGEVRILFVGGPSGD